MTELANASVVIQLTVFNKRQVYRQDNNSLKNYDTFFYGDWKILNFQQNFSDSNKKISMHDTSNYKVGKKTCSK
jgi:hypothetical protein